MKLLAISLILLASHLLVAMAALNDAQKAEVLEAHNYFRSIVNPIATDMAALEWDDGLAQLAQFWAVNCELMENENRHAQSTEYDYVGENLAASGNFSVNYTTLVGEWWAQGQIYNYDSATCTDEDGEEDEVGCGSYTQLVWATSFKFGCGAYRCEELRDFDDEDEGDALLLVCDYGPGGGALGVMPYQTGRQSCSSCPSQRPLCENNLCIGSGTLSGGSQLSLFSVLVVLGVASIMM